MRLGPYPVWVFDCDGVLLDSNGVKSEAFWEVGAQYSSATGDALLDHHRATGGVSRFVKIRWLHETLLGVADESKIEADLERFGEICTAKLTGCAVLPGVRDFLAAIPRTASRFVVSGGKQSEVEHALLNKKLTFDGIFGSPGTKEAHLRTIRKTVPVSQGVFFGDSRYDHTASAAFDMDFVFVSGVSEFDGASAYFDANPILGSVPDFLHCEVSQ